MPLSFTNDTAFHEAGHTIITYLNSDFFTIKHVTIDPTISKEIDGRAVGGINARLSKDPDSLSLMDHDKLCICSLAGLAADDVNHSDGKIISNDDAMTSWERKMILHKYLGDYNMLKPHLYTVYQYLTVDRRTYIKSCQELLYTLFTHNQILPVLTMMKEMLDRHKSVTGKQINTMLDTTPLFDWRLEKWNKTFQSRQQNMYHPTIG